MISRDERSEPMADAYRLEEEIIQIFPLDSPTMHTSFNKHDRIMSFSRCQSHKVHTPLFLGARKANCPFNCTL